MADRTIPAFKILRGNIGIGTTLPGSLFNAYVASQRQLDFYGGTSPSGNNYVAALKLGRGKASNSALEIKYDSEGSEHAYISRLYSNAVLHFDKSGTDHMTILANGSVGIGTATPYRNAHIYVAPNSDNFEGALQTGGTSAALGGYFGYNSTSSGRLSIISLNNTGGANAKIYLGFGLDGDGSPTTEVMTLTQGGSVGIGTTAPSAPLTIRSTTIPQVVMGYPTGTNEHRFYWDSSKIYLSADHEDDVSNSGLIFNVDGNEIMRMNGANVGIGTDAPTRLLTLENNTGTVVNQSQLRINNAGAGDSYIYMYAGADWSFGIDNSDADKFKFNISNDVSDGTEVLTLQRDGNVGIGTDNPLTPLHIYTDSASAREIFFDNDGSGEVGITFRTDRKTNGALTGFIRFDANDAGDNNTRYATIEAYSDDVTGGAEDGRLTFSTMVGATDTETMHIVGGNVGIGTDAPGQLLHVYKAGVLEPNFQSTTGRVGLQLNAGAAGDVSWILYSGYPAAGDFNIRESGVANHFVIKKTTGSVGIGIATPDHNLHVSYASTVTDTTAGFLSGTAGPGIRLQNTSNTASTYFPIDFRCSDADARIAFQYSGVSNQGQIIFITEANSTSPKFGIYDRGDGATKILVNDTATSTAPTKTFHAKWSSSNTAADSGEGFLGGTAGTGVLLENTNSTAGIYANLDLRAYDADARIAVKRDAANTADFWFVQDNNGAANHTMVVKANGCVGIGTHTPGGRLAIRTTANEKSLWIAPSAATTANVFHMECDSLTTGSAIYVHSNTSNSSARNLVYINNDHSSATGTTCLYINQDSTGTAIKIDKTNVASGGDFDFVQMYYSGSWGSNLGGIAAISASDGNGTIGRYGIAYASGGGRFVVTDLYDGGYGASGDVFYVKGDGNAYIQGTLTAAGFSGSGASLTSLSATQLTSGTVNVNRLGSSGTRSSSTFLRGDNQWATPSGSTPNNATITLAAGTALTTGGAFTTNQSSNETITFNVANPFLLGDNTDTYGIIGRAKVGYIGHGDYAGFAHRDVGTTTSYALIQDSVGSTFLNAANAKTISFRINNANVIAMDATSLYSVSNGVENLGKTGNRWGIVYSEDGNFSGDITVDGNWNGLDWEDLPNISSLSALP
jgi:hypothetical protein